MFELQVKSSFSAAHHLVGYPGDCARVHGHTWNVEFYARALKLDSVGMALDFKVLKSAIREVLGRWDHQDLNTLPEFKGTNPTAENIAQLAFDQISAVLHGTPGAQGVWIDRVTVWESATASATFFSPERDSRV